MNSKHGKASKRVEVKNEKASAILGSRLGTNVLSSTLRASGCRSVCPLWATPSGRGARSSRSRTQNGMGRRLLSVDRASVRVDARVLGSPAISRSRLGDAAMGVPTSARRLCLRRRLLATLKRRIRMFDLNRKLRSTLCASVSLLAGSFVVSAQSSTTTVTNSPGDHSRITTVAGPNGKTATYQNNATWGNGTYTDNRSVTGFNGMTATSNTTASHSPALIREIRRLPDSTAKRHRTRTMHHGETEPTMTAGLTPAPTERQVLKTSVAVMDS